MTQRKQVGTIDMTPTWRGMLPTLLLLHSEGKAIALEELQRMADLADAHVAAQKEKVQE